MAPPERSAGALAQLINILMLLLLMQTTVAAGDDTETPSGAAARSLLPRKALSGPFWFTCRRRPPAEARVNQDPVVLMAFCVFQAAARCDKQGNVHVYPPGTDPYMPFCLSHCECTDDAARAWADRVTAQAYLYSRQRQAAASTTPLSRIAETGEAQCKLAPIAKPCTSRSDCGRQRPHARWSCDGCPSAQPATPSRVCVLHGLVSSGHRRSVDATPSSDYSVGGAEDRLGLVEEPGDI